jgi:hypothetical protein
MDDGPCLDETALRNLLVVSSLHANLSQEFVHREPQAAEVSGLTAKQQTLLQEINDQTDRSNS